MKFKLKYAMLGLALSVASCAAYFSIWGLSQLFAGASTAVIVMASVLEIGKLVTTTALHTYWNKLAGLLKIYLTLSVLILMVITSAGIYGFLSNAYQSTANKLEIHEGELGILKAKKETFEKSVSDNQKLIDTKTKRLDQLSNLRSNQESRLDNSSSNRAKNSVRNDIKAADSEIQKLNAEIDGLNAKNIVLSDSINSYNVKAIELKSGSSVAAEVGPLKYISQMTDIPMASVVNYMILLFMLVFDPLAIALVLITNRIFQLESEAEIKKPDTTKKLLEDIVEELKEEELKEEQKKHIIDIMKSDEELDLYEEPIEYSDEEKIDEPIFENILEPTDESIVSHDESNSETELVEENVSTDDQLVFPELDKENKQEEEEEYDELHAFDMVMNKIFEDVEEIKAKEIFEIEQPAQVEEQEQVQAEEQEQIEEILPVEEETYLPKGKIELEDIKEIKERNRGFSVNIPEPKRNNFIERIKRK